MMGKKYLHDLVTSKDHAVFTATEKKTCNSGKRRSSLQFQKFGTIPEYLYTVQSCFMNTSYCNFLVNLPQCKGTNCWFVFSLLSLSEFFK